LVEIPARRATVSVLVRDIRLGKFVRAALVEDLTLLVVRGGVADARVAAL